MAFSDSGGVGLLFRISSDSRDARQDLTNLRGHVTKEVKGITDNFASSVPVIGKFTSALSPATLGAVALGGAGLALGGALISLAKSATDAGSRFNDLSIKSGLAVETLSGLELQIKQSGASLETLTTGFFNLQKQQAAARQGSDEAAAALRRVGVDAKATGDDALRQFVAGLLKIEDAGARNAAGAAVMGRAYKDLSVFIADTNGDLDAVVEKARRAGLVMSTEAAQASDALGDKLDELSYSLAAAGRQMASPVLPAFIGALNDMTGAAEGTVSGLNSIGQAIASIIDGGRIAAGVLKAIAENDIYRIPAMIEQIRFEQRARALGAPSEDVYGPGGTMRGGRDKPAFDDPQGAEKRAAEARAAAEKARRVREEAEREAERAEDKRIKALEDDLARQKEYANVSLEAHMAYKQQEYELEEIYRRRRLELIERGERAETMTHETAERARQGEEARAFVARIERLERAIEVAREVGANGAKILEMQRELARTKAERNNFVEARQERITDATKRDTEARLRNAEAIAAQIEADARKADADRFRAEEDRENERIRNFGVPEVGDTSLMGRLFGADVQAQMEEGASQWQVFGETVGAVIDEMSTRAGGFSGLIQGVLGQMSLSLTSGVQQWVLYGNVGPNAMRKMAAGVLASLAAQSLAQAAFEGAMYFVNKARASAAFATGNVFSGMAYLDAARNNLTAAATFGVVGVAAAAGGRLIAGNAFSEGSGRGATGAGNTGGGGQTAQDRDRATVVDVSRRQSAPTQKIQLTMNLALPDGTIVGRKETIIDAWTSDYHNNGRVRTVLRRENEN